MHTTSLIPLSLLLNVYSAFAVKFSFDARFVKHAGRLQGRASISGQPIANTHNAEYISNITLGGQNIPVMLDTGSSDLWVTGSVPGSTDTGKSATLSYAVGQAGGDINTATLTFDNYTVDNQAYLLVTNTSSFSTNITTQGYSGLVGLGPNAGSVIRQKVGDASGDSMLNRIFQQNKTTQNYITFLLNRLDDAGETFTGQITISEPVAGFENITSQPKMSVETVPGLTAADQHWQILSDKDKGVIGPDGQVIKISSIVPKAPDGQLVAVFDSGFTFPQVSRVTSDAIYGCVQGAQFNTEQQLWLVPCDQMLNISFNFGGVNYPIHPLDTVSDDFNMTDSSGNSICIGTFQPITTAFSLLGSYDVILGMGFLRNTYTLLDYGDFIDESSNDRGSPFVQLLPLTNVNTAHNDFVQSRLNGQDTTGSPSKALLPASQCQHSPESEEEKKQHYEEMVLSRWPYILAGCFVFLILSIALIIWRCCRRNRRKKMTKAGLLPEENTTYAPLHDQHSSLNLKPLGDSHSGNYSHGSYDNGGYYKGG